MPGGTARLRVSGAIARRFGSVIGPSLKGSNSLVWLMSGMSAIDDDRGQLGIAAVFAMAKAIRRAQTSCARVPFATLARRAGAGGRCRMICSESAAAQHEPPLARRSGGRSIPGGRPEGGAADRSAGGRGAITLQRTRFFRPRSRAPAPRRPPAWRPARWRARRHPPASARRSGIRSRSSGTPGWPPFARCC